MPILASRIDYPMRRENKKNENRIGKTDAVIVSNQSGSFILVAENAFTTITHGLCFQEPRLAEI